MIKPRNSVAAILCVAAFFCLLLSAARVEAQTSAQPEANRAADTSLRGVELYQQGDDAGAIAALRRAVKQDKNDIRAWHFLGLAYSRQGKLSDARKAHERAAKAGEQLLLSRYETAPLDYILKQQAELQPLLDAAADSADRYLQLSSKPSQKKLLEWHERADLLRDLSSLMAHDNLVGGAKIWSTREVTTKARILNRPEPQYTEEARAHLVRGTVVIRAVLAADGQVRAIRPIRTLPYGLTLKAISAARRIKFIPATVNDAPVSQAIQLEYNFNVY
jgi:TonB family protein